METSTVTYQWAKDGSDVTGATSATLVLSDADIGSIFTVTASYTDDDGNSESEVSAATGAVEGIDQPFQFTYELITASQIETIGAYADNPNETIIKLTLNLDILRSAETWTGTTNWIDSNSNGIIDESEQRDDNVFVGDAVEAELEIYSIAQGDLDIILDWTKIEAIDLTIGGVSSEKMYYYDQQDITATTWSGSSEDMTIQNFVTYDANEDVTQFNEYKLLSFNILLEPELRLVDSVASTTEAFNDDIVDIPSELDVAVFYINPIEGVSTLDIEYGGNYSFNLASSEENLDQLNYTMAVDIV
jgi:hypothetical protein